MPILFGVTASSGLADNFGAYDSIATVTIGAGGASTAVFSSIPSTYKHLQIRIVTKNSDANNFGSTAMTINGAAGERNHEVFGQGTIGTGAPARSMYVYHGGAANFGAVVVDILDYASTTKTKVSRALCGVDNNGTGLVAFVSGLETDTAAVSSLTFTSNSGNFAQDSSFALYGIKG